MSDYLDPNNEELLKDFFDEADLQIQILEQNILVLENNPSNRDAVDEIFRAAHTLKGASATVQMNELAEFTHVLEDVLDDIRSDVITISSEVVDTLLDSIDIIKAMLEARADGGTYDEDISSVVNRLRGFSGEETPKEPKEKAAKPVPGSSQPVVIEPGVISEYELLEFRGIAGDLKHLYMVDVTFNPDNPMNSVGGIQVFATLKSAGKVLKTDPDFDKLYEDSFYPRVYYYIATDCDKEDIGERLKIPDVITGITIDAIGEAAASKPAAPPKVEVPAQGQAEEKTPSQKAEPKGEAKVSEGRKAAKGGSVLRVDSRRIDDLLNLVSETVINKATFNQIANQFSDAQLDLQTTESTYRERLKELFDTLPDYIESIQKGRSVKEVKKEILDEYGNMFTLFDTFGGKLKNTVSKFRSTNQNLSRITGELQEGVMQIRMVPISQIFSRFPRLVRDVSKSLGKKVNLILEGEDTELDKSVIEDLLDPLIHCVRNSIDHGVEIPSERKAAGKEEDGVVRLKASNEGNMIIIEISDDGKGIDIDAVHQRAIDRGIIHPSKRLSDIEAFNLIFDAGFSTAKEVTNISGRGVGLDVVKKQIEKLNGNVSVWSEKGKGTHFTIKLPLTLAIIQGLLVRVGSEIYAIPISSVVESHRIKPDEIKFIYNYEVFNVREDVVSLLRLNRLFNIASEEEGEYNFVVIVGTADKKMGLMIDALIGEEDVVIKPLRDRYTNSPGIAGATILGDGTVSLIIDVSQLLDLGLRKEIENRRRRAASIS